VTAHVPRLILTMAGAPPTHLSLFSGIGGLDLGLSRAGFDVVGQVEIDPGCRGVLTRHWPAVPKHDDVATVIGWWHHELGGRPITLISGGLPCQPFSRAGRKRGVSDERWLWEPTRDAIGHIGPTVILLENVPALLRTEAFGVILADLASLGFDAEWSLLSACSLGYPHVRRRLFIVAYTHGILGSTRVAHDDRWSVRANRRRQRGSAIPAYRLDANGRGSGMAGRVAAQMVRAIGNVVVPDVAQYVGRRILTTLGAPPCP